MNGIAHQFYEELQARIYEARDAWVEQVAGDRCASIEHYRHATGRIAAFDDVLNVMGQIRAKITGGE